MADKQVKYEIRADVQGRESITGLADDLDNVAKVLNDDLAKQAQAAAARLRELADQDAAITAFNRLQSEARDAGRALKAAETEAANYGKQITAMGPPTAQEAAALQRLQAATEGTRATFAQQQQALAGAQGELQRYGVAGQNAQAAQQRLRQEVAQVRESVQGLAPAYQGAATGAQNAGTTMNRTHRAIGEGVDSISQQLSRLQSFYAALQGFQGLKTMASELAQTADQVNNLQSRIKLVTGEGENFTRAWQGVTDVALRTHSALEETGTLFTRLAQAGKDAGLTTADASAQALALAETINQTIQLSGASAEASSAAITQLVQGLQGGALRGDEFNSVMEQSPRLARALADGLGVTTGALRKMAEAGLLTSDTVIKALQGQSQTVATEFSKLPPTVGRALQDLSTQWTLYVGETDKATGASTAAAMAISALANNLKTIAGLLMDVGQAATAFAALRLAQHFLGVGVAVQQATVATVAHAAATRVNTAATIADTVAGAARNTQLAASGTSAATASVSVGRFATILAGLRTFTLLGLITNFQDIGTWIGESAAKLMGYKDRTEELARAEKLQADIAKEAAADRARLATAIQAAIDKQFELSNAARSAVAEFDQLTKTGSTAAEAVKKVTDGFDLSKIQGVKDFSATLDKLAADGKLSATELQAAWAQALSGKDLAQFEVMARAAFAGSAREGERVAQVMDATVREAVKRTGLDYDVLQGKIGAASRSAINDTDAIVAGLDRLKAQGVDTGQALTASIGKGIQTADSQKAIEAVRQQIESVRKVLGDKITDGLLDQAAEKARQLGDAADKAKPGVNSLREAFSELGMKAPEDIAAIETRMAGVTEELKKAAAQGLITGDQLAEGLAKAQQKIDEIKPGINSISEAMKTLGVTSDAELKRMANASESAYFKLKNSATASVREINDSFKKFADDQIKANDGVATEWLKQEAAVRGYKIALDEAGKATVALNDGRKNSKQSSDDTAAGYTKEANALRDIADASRAAEAAERSRAEAADTAERKRLNIDKEGFSTDKAGNRIAMGGDLSTLTGIAAFLKAAGVDDEAEARRIAKEFANEKGQIDYINNAGQIKYGGRASTMSQAVLAAAEKYTFSDKNTKTSSIPSQTQTININFEGKKTSVTVATANDAAALKALIDQLTAAAGRT